MDMDRHIECKGIVSWSLQKKSKEKKEKLFYETGIEFKSVGENDRKKIEGVLSKLLKNQEK